MVAFFVIGFPKCGTTTLQAAFRHAGLRAAHYRIRDGFCGQLMYEDFRAGRDPFSRFAYYDCVTQADVCQPTAGRNFWPQLDFAMLDAVQRHNPGIRFVLNRRPVADHVRSIKRWGNLHQRLTVADIPGLPAGAGGRDEDLATWIEEHYRACRERFAGRDDFLELDITAEDAAAKLGEFSGRRFPWWGVERSGLWPGRPTPSASRARSA